MDEPPNGSERETPDGSLERGSVGPCGPIETESGPPAQQRARPRHADIEVTLGRFLIFLAFPLVALAGALRLFDVDLGVFPPRLVHSNPPEASAEPVPEKPETPPEEDAAAPDTTGER